MSRKRAAKEVINEEHQPIKLTCFERTSAPTIYQESSSQWRISLWYYGRTTGNDRGIRMNSSKRYKSEDEAIEEAMEFRIMNETQRRSNRDRERVWIGNSSGKYNDVATNCNALTVTDQTSFSKVRIETPDLTLTRNEWRVYSADEVDKIAVIHRAIRRSNQVRRKRAGLSITYHGLRLRGKIVYDKLNYYQNYRAAALTNEIKFFIKKRELFSNLLQSNEVHRLIMPNDVDIPIDTEDINQELDPIHVQEPRVGKSVQHEPPPGDRPSAESYSVHQLTKVRKQCSSIYFFYRRVNLCKTKGSKLN